MRTSTVLSIQVQNHFGVLMRVTTIFSRRAYNIKSLTVAETENPAISRITIWMEGDEDSAENIRRLLLKQEDVLAAAILPQSEVVTRQLLLVKICSSPDADRVITVLTMDYQVKVISRDDDRTILQVAGTPAETELVLRELTPFGIIEVCPTGISAVSTGKETIFKED